ncbi:MAG: hypothetical protein EPO20_30470 [Betaproteobacteria bacterium]|nr:MAG: hypothetical protein EPO20_30470 [Betaproteobacteria bacterium]
MDAQRRKSYFRRTFKIGSSLAVTLPHWFVTHLPLAEGSMVEIIECEKSLEITAAFTSDKSSSPYEGSIEESATDKYKNQVDGWRKAHQPQKNKNRRKK